MIFEEVRHLKSTVNKFSEFARLPQVQLADVDLVDEVSRLLKAIPDFADIADFELRPPAKQDVAVRLDTTLFRQVLTNIFRNGVEANPGRRVRFGLFIDQQAATVTLRIANDGVPVPAEIVPRMFDPYISTKSGADNMGLGLAIVKKIVLEHGGDIRYEESEGHPAFVLVLPRCR
jgi:signal transduction histidine kinase